MSVQQRLFLFRHMWTYVTHIFATNSCREAWWILMWILPFIMAVWFTTFICQQLLHCNADSRNEVHLRSGIWNIRGDKLLEIKSKADLQKFSGSSYLAYASTVSNLRDCLQCCDLALGLNLKNMKGSNLYSLQFRGLIRTNGIMA